MTAPASLFLRKTLCSALLLGAAWLIGCDKQEVRVYDAPKEKRADAGPEEPAASDQSTAAQTPAGNSAEVAVDGMRFRVPAGWKKIEPKPTDSPMLAAMRLAAYDVSTADGHAEMVITHIRGGGDLLENVNRWRRQIKLDPVEQVNDSDFVPVKIGGQAAKHFEVASEEQKIVTAFLVRDGEMITFKLSGKVKAVEDQHAAFADFLETVQFTK